MLRLFHLNHKSFLFAPFHVTLLLCAGLCIGMSGAAQSADSQTLDLDELANTPVTIGVSPDYLTVIEFEEVIESVRSGGGNQISAEVDDNIISIRAEQADVNTDLIIDVGERTALFTLVSDPDAVSPTRYLVLEEPPVEETQVAQEQEPQEETQPPVAQEETQEPQVAQEQEPQEEEPQEEATAETGLEVSEAAPLPPGLSLDIGEVYRSTPDTVVIEYALVNNSISLIANDPQRMRVYANGAVTEYERNPSSGGSSGRLSIGESEAGQIVLSNLPTTIDSLMIEWPLVEIGPGTLYTATRDLPIPSDAVADPALGAPVDAQDDSVAGEGGEVTSDVTREQPSAPEASATSAGSVEDVEALFPPEVLAEIRARGSDITVIGFPFDEPGRNDHQLRRS